MSITSVGKGRTTFARRAARAGLDSNLRSSLDKKQTLIPKDPLQVSLGIRARAFTDRTGYRQMVNRLSAGP